MTFQWLYLSLKKKNPIVSQCSEAVWIANQSAALIILKLVPVKCTITNYHQLQGSWVEHLKPDTQIQCLEWLKTNLVENSLQGDEIFFYAIFIVFFFHVARTKACFWEHWCHSTNLCMPTVVFCTCYQFLYIIGHYFGSVICSFT